MSKELSEICPLGEKMAKIWLKLQENGEKNSQMAKVMAKEKYILARTLLLGRRIIVEDTGMYRNWQIPPKRAGQPIF